MKKRHRYLAEFDLRSNARRWHKVMVQSDEAMHTLAVMLVKREERYRGNQAKLPWADVRSVGVVYRTWKRSLLISHVNQNENGKWNGSLAVEDIMFAQGKVDVDGCPVCVSQRRVVRMSLEEMSLSRRLIEMKQEEIEY